MLQLPLGIILISDLKCDEKYLKKIRNISVVFTTVLNFKYLPTFFNVKDQNRDSPV